MELSGTPQTYDRLYMASYLFFKFIIKPFANTSESFLVSDVWFYIFVTDV